MSEWKVREDEAKEWGESFDPLQEVVSSRGR